MEFRKPSGLLRPNHRLVQRPSCETDVRLEQPWTDATRAVPRSGSGSIRRWIFILSWIGVPERPNGRRSGNGLLIGFIHADGIPQRAVEQLAVAFHGLNGFSRRCERDDFRLGVFHLIFTPFRLQIVLS